MAKYGARYIKFGAIASEADGALPTYETAIGLEKLVKVTDSPTYAEGKLYADDGLCEYASEFTENSIDVEISELSNAIAKAIYGATEGADTNLVFGADDTAPYGGFGFISLKSVDNVKSFVGVFYPKVKAQPQSEEFSTKGDSIAFTTGKIKFSGTAAKNGAWKIVSPVQTTLAAAKTWLDGMFTGT
ncbi:MAG: major tail protein [Oscillospiraceae bacterium]|nr:major tail protein [Oscillospiraceae bacterium]